MLQHGSTQSVICFLHNKGALLTVTVSYILLFLKKSGQKQMKHEKWDKTASHSMSKFPLDKHRKNGPILKRAYGHLIHNERVRQH
jgi:hypothetical protein